MKNKNSSSWMPGTKIESSSYLWKEEPIFYRPVEESVCSELLAADLFCGAGGLSLGFANSGINTILGIDNHMPSHETFRKNHPYSASILGDIRKISNELVMHAIGNRTIDLVAAGVPCQGFSLNNRKRWAQDERNFLFVEFIRVVQLLQPKIVLLENVSGLQSTAKGEFKAAIANAIEQQGYRVSFQMLNAADYGVPQKRGRVFFLGVRNGLTFEWPNPTHGDRTNKQYVGVWDAIGDLPEICSGESAYKYDKEPFSDYQRQMRKGAIKLLNHIAPNHPNSVVEKIGSTKPGEPIYSNFKQRIRLHPKRPSPTQVAGGIRPQFQFGHPTTPRGLTVRERCRIQSFPDTYEIFGGVVMGRVQTGQAVPPLLAEAIGKQIVVMLKGEDKTDSSYTAEPPQLGLISQA